MLRWCAATSNFIRIYGSIFLFIDIFIFDICPPYRKGRVFNGAVEGLKFGLYTEEYNSISGQLYKILDSPEEVIRECVSNYCTPAEVWRSSFGGKHIHRAVSRGSEQYFS